MEYRFRPGVKYKTVGGYDAKVLGFDDGKYPLVVSVKINPGGEQEWFPFLYTREGKIIQRDAKLSDTDLDLVPPIVRKVGWVAIFPGREVKLYDEEPDFLPTAEYVSPYYWAMDVVKIEYNSVEEERLEKRPF